MAITSDRIKQARKEKGLTMDQLAEFMGTTKMTISRWENGSVTPRIAKIKELSNILNVSNEYLLGLSDDKNSKTPEFDKVLIHLSSLDKKFYDQVLKELSGKNKQELNSLVFTLSASYLNGINSENNYKYLSEIMSDIFEITNLKQSKHNDIRENQEKLLGKLINSVVSYIDNVSPIPD